ncbi:MAG: AMP-binding protein, partial [Pseudomonadota bacterium]|nr:AMP-binding protein [Pseudomonadota bacterium]
MSKMVDIATAIAGHAAARPNAIALNFDGNRIAWQSFQAEVGDWASAFMAQTSGDKIALSFDNSAELAIAVCAAIRAGKCAQVLDPAWPSGVADKVVSALGPDLFLDTRPPQHPRPGPTECRPD